MSAWVVPVKVENVGDDDARGNAREQDRLEVRARLRVRREVRERPGYRTLSKPASSGCATPLA